MKDLMGVMKQAQELQARMEKMQEELENTQIEGTAGGGLVTVTLNGKGEMRGMHIDESLLKPDERVILEDLIVAAHQNARAKVEEVAGEKMRALTGGLPLPPGLKLF